MKTHPEPSADAAVLRRRAEARFCEQQQCQSPDDAGPKTPEDAQRLLHELQVHQIELEMQGEELLRSRAEIEAGLQRFSELYDFAPTGCFSLAADGVIRQVNLTGARLLGVERSRLVNRRIQPFVSDETRPAFTAFLQQVFASPDRQSCPLVLLAPGQPPRPVRIEAALSPDGQEGRAVVLDLTECHAAEQEWQTTFDAISEGVALLTPDGRLRRCNRAFTVLLGQDLPALTGQKCCCIMHGNDDNIAGCALVRARQSRVREQMELALGGRILTVAVDPIVDADGKLSAFVYLTRDITERKRAEAEMTAQVAELTRWHDAMLDREGRVLEVKKEVNALLARLGEPPRYPSVEEEPATATAVPVAAGIFLPYPAASSRPESRPKRRANHEHMLRRTSLAAGPAAGPAGSWSLRLAKKPAIMSAATPAPAMKIARRNCVVMGFSFVLVAWAALGGAACAAEAEPLPLLSGCEQDYPPFCIVHKDGRADGFSVELLRAALKALRREVTFRTGPWAEVKGWLESGEVQVLPLVGRTPEREAVFDFTVPYLTMHGAIVVRQGATGINSLSDPRGRRVAVMKGDNAEEFLRREDRGLDILTTPTFTEAFQILSTGRCEAVVVQRLVALRLLAENRLTHLRIVEQPIQGFSQDFCFAVREGDRDLLALLNEGLALVVADGTHRRLHAKWFAALELPSNRPVIIGGDHNYPPFEYLDEKGKPAGFTVELTRAIARELNLNVQFRLGPWAEAVEALRQGEIDAIGGMFYSAKRDQALDFSPRYLVIHCVSVVRRGAGVPPGAFEELAGRDLVVQAEDAILDTMRERDIKARITTVETQEEVVRAVAEGRHECGLVIRLGALHAIRKHGWTNLVVGDRTLYSGDYCFAVPAGRTALLAEFSEGLHALEQSGEYHSIYEKWLGAYEPDPPAWRRGMKSVVLVAVPLLTIAMLALAWSWNLRRQVAQRTAELADQYRLLRVAGQTARFGGWSVELATQQCTWSDTVADIHEMPSGFSPTVEEGIGYYASEWREKIRQVFAACARDGTPYDEELEILTARGKRVWVRTTGEAVRDESGKIMRVQGSFQEITARKHAEEAMRTAAQSYRRLFDANPQPMWIYDLESLRFLAVNDLAVDRYGYTRDEFLQMTLKDIQPAEDVPRLLDNAARSTGEVQESGLGRHRKKNGEVILIEIASHSLHWMGHPARVVLAHDVTAHERSRQELQSSEERFRRAVVDSPFPILLHAEDGAILQVSNSWCEITGYTREELATVSDWTERAYGEKWTLVQAEIDALYRLDHRKYEGDYTIRTRSGAMRVWEFSSAPLGRLPDGRRLVISMALDVTERRAAEAAARRALARVEASRKVLLNVVEDRKRAEAEVRQLNASLEQRVAARTAQLEAANKELEAFCYSVSHDLRAPLRGIDGWSLALLEDCGGQLDAQGRQHLARVRSETQRMGQLIDDLLALSRVTRCDLCPGPVDLSALAQRSAARLRQAAPGRAVELLIQPGLETQGDARLLEAALTNLLDNAWKFTGKRAAARIEFGRLEQQGAPVYFVRDNGAGFDPAHARKLFAPFQRLHRAEDFPGTGVGLATVQRILARHGGRIWAEAQVDRGATFFFTLAEEGCIMQNA